MYIPNMFGENKQYSLFSKKIDIKKTFLLKNNEQ